MGGPSLTHRMNTGQYGAGAECHTIIHQKKPPGFY